jgi:hypothetical protein
MKDRWGKRGGRGLNESRIKVFAKLAYVLNSKPHATFVPEGGECIFQQEKMIPMKL